MGWLLLWTGIILLFVATMVACGWRLWRKGRALATELAAQGRTLGELIATVEGLGLAADRPARPTRDHESDLDGEFPA